MTNRDQIVGDEESEAGQIEQNLCNPEDDSEPLVNNSGDILGVENIYDPHSPRFVVSSSETPLEQQGTGWFLSSMLIVNAALGAGLLNFPYAFHEAGGVTTANFVQLALLCFIAPALIILAYCSNWNKARTLQQVLAFTWGKNAERITSLCISLYCFGTCITFLIIIGDQFDRVFASVYGSHFCGTWYLNRSFTTVVSSVIFILPFCYPRKIDFLKHISSVGVVAVIYVVILVIVQYYSGHYIPGDIKTQPTEWTDVFLVVPTICFGYQCHVSVIPIYSCFKQRDLKHFTAAITVALSVCVFTYTIAATFGYLTFGSSITSDILLSYDAHDPYVLIAIVAISIKTYTTYPILCFCGNAALIDLWTELRRANGHSVDASGQNKFRLISISIWFALSVVLAVLLPNIGPVIKLLGSLAAVFIFIFPGVCLLKISEKQYESGKRNALWLTGVSGLFLCVGAFIFGCVLTQAILRGFIYVRQGEPPLCTV